VTIDRARHGRQIRLREIGEAGQARLAAASVPLRGRGFAREIEATYLRLAGVGQIEEGGSRAQPAPTLGLRSEAAREVGEGALAALAAIRTVLGVDSG
jgi:hypothetical protein